MIRFGVGARLIELDSCRNAAHVDTGLRLRHAAVLAHPADRRGNAFGLAEGLDGDARDRPHVTECGDVAGIGGGLYLPGLRCMQRLT
jgi:hypothetical protein